MNKVFGGTVHKKSVREDGVFSITLDNTCSLFRYTGIQIIRTRLEIPVWKLVASYKENSEIAPMLISNKTCNTYLGVTAQLTLEMQIYLLGILCEPFVSK